MNWKQSSFLSLYTFSDKHTSVTAMSYTNDYFYEIAASGTISP